jgi:hypothetical protein
VFIEVFGISQLHRLTPAQNANPDSSAFSSSADLGRFQEKTLESGLEYCADRRLHIYIFLRCCNNSPPDAPRPALHIYPKPLGLASKYCRTNGNSGDPGPARPTVNRRASEANGDETR